MTKKNDKNIVSNISKTSNLSFQNRCFDIIKSNIGESECSNISLESNISSTTMDSITFIKIVVALESEFNFEFDDEMLLIIKFPTVKSMIEYVESEVTSNCENSIS